MGRGRLIFPVLAEIARLDTLATDQDPDGAGSLTSGYDSDFKEPVLVKTTAQETQFGAPRGDEARKDQQTIKLPCQYETDNFELLQQWASGKVPGFRLNLVFHFRDLERLSLVDSNGHAKIRVNDRLCAIYHKRTGKLIQEIPDPPGLFVIEPQPTSFGLVGGYRNLLEVVFMEREKSVRRT